MLKRFLRTTSTRYGREHVLSTSLAPGLASVVNTEEFHWLPASITQDMRQVPVFQLTPDSRSSQSRRVATWRTTSLANASCLASTATTFRNNFSLQRTLTFVTIYIL